MITITAQRLAVAVTVANFALLAFLLDGRAAAQGEPPVVRGRGLELVDSAGRVRAQFTVEPDGEAVFRLRDRTGTIRVKLAAGEDGSGLLLLDEATEPAVQIVARRSPSADRPSSTSINLTGANGQRRTIAP
jgi:hypothetical protein